MIEQILILLASLLVLTIVVMIPVFKVVSQKYPYASVQARLRVMRKKLLRAEDFERLLDADYNDIVYRLDKKVFLKKNLDVKLVYPIILEILIH